MFIRIKNLKRKDKKMMPYAYLVESKYIKGTGPRQYVKKYLGRIKNMDVLNYKNIIFDNCKICGNKENLEIDHIMPLSKGGSNHFSNLQILCLKCNRKKGNHIVHKKQQTLDIYR